MFNVIYYTGNKNPLVASVIFPFAAGGFFHLPIGITLVKQRDKNKINIRNK